MSPAKYVPTNRPFHVNRSIRSSHKRSPNQAFRRWSSLGIPRRCPLESRRRMDQISARQWHDHRHLERSFRGSGIGSVCHRPWPKKDYRQVSLDCNRFCNHGRPLYWGNQGHYSSQRDFSPMLCHSMGCANRLDVSKGKARPPNSLGRGPGHVWDRMDYCT